MPGKTSRYYYRRCFAVVAISPLLVLGGILVYADQLDDVCRKKCSDAIAQYQKSAGSSPPAGFFDTCMENCKSVMLIRSEADIPVVCKSNCTKVLQTLKMTNTPGAMEDCVANCTKRTTENFRRMRNQQTPAGQPGR
jgi:hypothetical protein